MLFNMFLNIFVIKREVAVALIRLRMPFLSVCYQGLIAFHWKFVCCCANAALEIGSLYHLVCTILYHLLNSSLKSLDITVNFSKSVDYFISPSEKSEYVFEMAELILPIGLLSFFSFSFSTVLA